MGGAARYCVTFGTGRRRKREENVIKTGGKREEEEERKGSRKAPTEGGEKDAVGRSAVSCCLARRFSLITVGPVLNVHAETSFSLICLCLAVSFILFFLPPQITTVLSLTFLFV